MSMTEKEAPDQALVVLSGGQDSTTCLYWAKQNFDQVHAIGYYYNQRHERELLSARKISEMAGVPFEVIDIGAGALKGKSPLTNLDQPLETYNTYEEMDKTIGDRVELTFVPMRNALFLTIAANRAVILGARNIVTGVCQQDNANYPDCRRVFIDAQEAAINQALGLEREEERIQIHTPLMLLTKAESIKLAKELPGCMDALAWSHTAYDGHYPPTSKDHASMLRAQGFLEANEPDPLVLRAYREGLMPLPDTPNYNEVRERDAALAHIVR